MALNAGTVWEVRTTGANDNGGGFYNRVPGTSVDYSQQAAPQLSLADIATNVAGTGISSVAGGFTAAMAGNLIRLDGGGGSTAGWYEITAVADGNNATIDRSAGSSKAGIGGKVGGAFLIGGALDDEWISAVVAGNTAYIQAGTYTAAEQMSVAAHAPSNTPIRLIGYSAARGDNPSGANRPLINVVGAPTCFGSSTYNGWGLFHLRFATSEAGATAVAFNQYTTVVNCSFFSDDAAAASFGDGSLVVACEFEGGTTGLVLGGYGATAFQCYAHDCDTGISIGQQGVVAFCCVQSCTAGINQSLSSSVLNCSVWGCTNGVVEDNYSSRLVNTIVDGCDVGVNVTANPANHVYLFNQLHNTADIDVTTGAFLWGNRYQDPGLQAPAADDFRIQENDPPYAQAIEAAAFTSVKI